MLMGYKEEGIFRRVGEFALKYVSTHVPARRIPTRNSLEKATLIAIILRI